MNSSFLRLVALCFCCSNSHADGLLSVNNPARNGQELSAYANFDVFEGHDHSLLNGSWPAALSTRDNNINILFAKAESGVQWNGFRLGAIRRFDTMQQSNRDASDLVQQYDTNIGYQVNRTYTPDYKIIGFDLSGFKIGKSLATNINKEWNIRSGISVSFLKGNRLKIENIQGQVVAINSNEYTGNALQNNSSSSINTNDDNEFIAPYHQQLPFSGNGYTFDLGFILEQTSTGARAEFAIADFASAVNWKYIPNNLSLLGTESTYVDANGYINFNPAAYRASSYRNINQTLDPKIRLAATYPWRAWQLQAAADHTQGTTFFQTGVGYRIAPDWLLQADYDWHFGTLGLGIKHPNFDLMLRSDSTQWDAAKAFGLQAKLHFPL